MEKQRDKSQESDSNVLSKRMELILFNDEVNSFEYVIDCLIEVCDHSAEQAEQCALVAHFKGKCGIKFGSYAELVPINDELNRRGLSTVLS